MTGDHVRRALAREATAEHRRLVDELRSAAATLTMLAKDLSDRPEDAGLAASRLVNVATTIGQATRSAAALQALNLAVEVISVEESA
jgi:hypothetical protein